MALPEFPLSRNEQYLNRIATGGGELPEMPLSRIEQYLDYIANHGGGTEGVVSYGYDPDTSYTAGQYAIYGGKLYKATADTTGEFDPTKWQETVVTDELGGGVRYDKPQTLTDAEKKQALLNLSGIRIIPLTDGTETLASIAQRVSDVNEDGEHVFFDTAAIGYPLYLCTITINYEDDVPTTYRLNDMVSGKASLGSYDADKTLAEILSEVVDSFYTITVTCVTQDGVTVTGQTVTLRQGDESGPVYATAAYNGQPVSFVVPVGFAYHASVTSTLAGHFNPTTATGVVNTDTSVILTYGDVEHLTTFDDVIAAVAGGAGDAIVGVEIADTWTSTTGTQYSDPMVVASVETVYDADNVAHTAAIMQRKYASYDSIQFDAAEKLVATGNYEAGMFYYVDDAEQASLFRLLVAGTDYNVGDAIVGTVYKNAIKDTTGYILRYGYNRYRDSAYRQYLNSNEGVGGWWEATHVGDVAPSQLNSVRGYKAGCSAALLAAAKPVKQNCYTNNVTDESAVDALCDLFWLPSTTQMYGIGNANEGTYWKYWKDATGLDAPGNTENAGRIHYQVDNHATAAQVRLRSAYRSNSCSAWYCHTNGNLGTSSAAISIRCAPACAIY